MDSRIVILFSETELDALRTIAGNEYRSLRDQVRYMVRHDLVQRGMLPEPDLMTGEVNHGCHD